MKTLLWKECRENLYKVLLGLAACLVVHFLRMSERFNADFAHDPEEWAWAFGLVAAAVFGMEILAGERSRGTMDFLSTRPLAPIRILGVKFLVGAMGLLVVVSGFWGMAYATPLTNDLLTAAPPGVNNHIMEDVSVGSMIQIWFLPLLVAYAMVFLGSAMAGDPVKAIAAGGLVWWVVWLLVLLLMGWQSRPWFDHIVDLEFGSHGYLVRIADDGWSRLRSIVIVAAVSGGLFAAALIKVTRFREYSLQWRPILGVAVVAIGVPVAALGFRPEQPDIPTTDPVGSHTVGMYASDVLVKGQTAYVLKRNELLAIDISRPDSMFEREAVPLSAGSPRKFAAEALLAIDRFVVVVGRTKGEVDSLRMVVVGSDPGESSRVLHTADLLPFSKGLMGYSFDPVGDVILLRIFEKQRTSLMTMRIDGDGLLDVLGELHIPREPTWEVSGQGVYADLPQDMHGRFGLHAGIAVRGDHAFLGMRNGLAIVDLQDPRDLRVLSTFELEPPNRRTGAVRGVVVKGDSLIISRQWPWEMVVLDVSDPERPETRGWLNEYSVYNRATTIGGYLVTKLYHEIALHDPDNPLGDRLETFRIPMAYSLKPVFTNGLMLVLRDEQLQAFRLESTR